MSFYGSSMWVGAWWANGSFRPSSPYAYSPMFGGETWDGGFWNSPFWRPYALITDLLDPRGRQPIAVNQPPHGGTNFPFTEPSDEIQHLLGDFYLSYRDDEALLEGPFRIAWLYGFGILDVTPPEGFPLPRHSLDLLVLDSNDQIVFDSTAATFYRNTLWGTRLEVIEWRTATAICRCTRYTRWSPSDLTVGAVRLFDRYITPENGELDPETCYRSPQQVRLLQVGNTTVPTDQAYATVELISGYNIAISEETETAAEATVEVTDATAVIAGARAVRRIRIDAVPGSGMGTVQGCEEIDPVIRLVDNVGPDSGGNLKIDAEGCIRQQRPVTVLTQDPRTVEYRAFGLTETEAAAALEVHNDCGPCCDCSLYVRTYKGLKRQWFLWQDLTTSAEAVRDAFARNSDRWILQKDCRESHPIRLAFMPEPGCKIAGGATYCNTNKCCIVPLTLRFTFRTLVDGLDAPEAAVSCADVTVEGSPQKAHGEEHYIFRGAFPVYEAVFDYANPQEVSRVSFRMCAAGCNRATALEMLVTAHYPEMLPGPAGEICARRDATDDVPAWALALWAESPLGIPPDEASAAMTSQRVVFDPTSPFCGRCNC